MMTSADAETLARLEHRDQVNKAGYPYADHLARVATAVSATFMDPDANIAREDDVFNNLLTMLTARS